MSVLEVPTTSPPDVEPTGAGAATLRARLLGVRADDRFWGWVGPLLVAAAGGFLRFWHLDRPPRLVFDETYYVKEAASMLKYGFERANRTDIKQVDDLWNVGNTHVWVDRPDFVVHPPLGKWLIGIGEQLFGVTSQWGWRFSVAVAGTLSILMMGRIARRLFGSTLLGTTAALLLALDGQHFVHSRTGILDIFVMTFALAAFGCFLIDRDQARARLADRAAARLARTGRLATFGPGLGVRWWRVAAGVMLGACTAVKWSGLYFTVAFLLMSVLWDCGARRAVGQRAWALTGLVRDGLNAAVSVVPVLLLVYLSSWIGWFRSTDGYDRQWARTRPAEAGWGWVPDSLRSLWKFEKDVYHSNVTLTVSHPYQSNPWSWLVQGRPTSYWYEGFDRGKGGCTALGGCSSAVTALGNPVIWWGGTLALLVVLFCWALRRDWRAGAVLAGMAGGYLPWFQYQQRTIYTFYTVAFLPWVVLGLVFVLGLMLGRPDSPPQRRRLGAAAAGAVVLAAVIAFAFFYPVWTGELISHRGWVDRMWFPSWI